MHKPKMIQIDAVNKDGWCDATVVDTGMKCIAFNQETTNSAVSIGMLVSAYQYDFEVYVFNYASPRTQLCDA